jgi:hypothetical protein
MLGPAGCALSLQPSPSWAVGLKGVRRSREEASELERRRCVSRSGVTMWSLRVRIGSSRWAPTSKASYWPDIADRDIQPAPWRSGSGASPPVRGRVHTQRTVAAPRGANRWAPDKALLRGIRWEMLETTALEHCSSSADRAPDGRAEASAHAPRPRSYSSRIDRHQLSTGAC